MSATLIFFFLMARDSFGQSLATAVDKLEAADGKSFTIRLKEPFPLLLDALGKVSGVVPFIMPERLAKTDPYQQVTETVGLVDVSYCRGPRRG